MSETPAAKPWIAPLLFLIVALVAFGQTFLFSDHYYFANDLISQCWPFLRLLKSDLSQGHIGLWNPYIMGGQPLFADLNYIRCNPFYYMVTLVPIPLGLTLYFMFHMFLASFGMYFLLKTFRFSESVARVGGLIYGLSGDFWWEIIHMPILTVLAFWPWLAACLERLSAKWNPKEAFFTGLVFAFIGCSGNFQLISSVVYGGIVFLAYRLYHWSSIEKTIPWSERLNWKKWLPIAVLGFWAASPLVLQFIPAYEFSGLSSRSKPNYDQLSGTFSMRPSSTYEFLFPYMGLPEGKSAEASIQDIDPPNTDNMSLGDFGYLGVWIPFLVFLAFKRKDKRFLYFLSAFSLISLFTAWGRYFPVHRLLCEILPGISFSRAPFRFLDVYVLFVILMSAYGYQALERAFSDDSDAHPTRKSWVLGGCVYGLFLLVIALFQADRNWREMLGLALGMAGLLYWGIIPGWRKMGHLLFQAALLLPLLLSGWGDFGTGPASNYDFDQNAPIFSYLQKAPTGSRFFMDYQIPMPIEENGQTFQYPIPQDEVLDYRVRLVNGYDSINIRRTAQLQADQIPLPAYAALWDIKGLIFGQDRGNDKDFDHQTIGAAHYYGLKISTSHLLAPSQIQVLPDDACLLALKLPTFNPAEQVVLPTPLPPDLAAQLSGKPAKLQYQWLKDENDRQSFEVTLDQPSLVTFSEVYYPGWKARIDQKPVPVLRANYDFRALVIPAGSHQVDFEYQPAWWPPLKLFILVWLLSLLPIGFFLKRKKAGA